MVIGVGIDLIEVSRIAELMERKGDRLIGRVFTPGEALLALGGRYEGLAGRFAAKEAVAKAMGTGIRGLSWNEIEILEDEAGKPVVTLHGRAKEIASQRGVLSIMVSISHLKDIACAVAVATGV